MSSRTSDIGVHSAESVVPGDVALGIENLTVGYGHGADSKTVVSNLSLQLRAGRILGLAGESGCGKSTASLAAIGYPSPGASILSGRSMLGETDLLSLPLNDLRRIWGRRIAFVSQQATTSLNPSLTVGAHLRQTLSVHLRMSSDTSRRHQVELLEMVDIPDPERAVERFPFQFSGGQQQRIAIAIALACQPEVLILDEPTTGLDVTTQARFSALLRSVVTESNVAALYVSHDLGLLYSLADNVTVMYAGQAAESGTRDVLERPRHPYTRALLMAAPSTHRPGLIEGIAGRPPAAVVSHACAFEPRCSFAVDLCREAPVDLVEVGDRSVRCVQHGSVGLRDSAMSPLPRATPGDVLLEADGVWCSYRNARSAVVRDVSVSLRRGEVVGIVGESGSGKSTLLRAIAGLHAPERGRVSFQGRELKGSVVHRDRAQRHQLQLIFQNPDTSLNPRHTIETLIARPIRLFRDDVSKREERDTVGDLLESVKLPRSILHSYPGQLSGGQKQRVAIARAFAAQPSVLLCDEITSALDVSVQATVLELLANLAVERETAVLFVSHDLAVVRSIADRALVMRQGEVCEQGPIEDLFDRPAHDYTQALISALSELPPLVLDSYRPS